MAEPQKRGSITDRPIDPGALLAAVGDASNGAAVLFVGTVRDHNEGREVKGIRYDAYREMAESVLTEIVNEAVDGAPGARVAAVHRVGQLQIGDASVAIAVSAPHRAESFGVCRYIIEQIKVRLPVWKHEQYAEGDSAWVAGTEPSTRSSH